MLSCLYILSSSLFALVHISLAWSYLFTSLLTNLTVVMYASPLSFSYPPSYSYFPSYSHSHSYYHYHITIILFFSLFSILFVPVLYLILTLITIFLFFSLFSILFLVSIVFFLFFSNLFSPFLRTYCERCCQFFLLNYHY